MGARPTNRSSSSRSSPRHSPKTPLFLSSPSKSVPPSPTLSNLFLQKNPMSYPLIRRRRHHRPIDLQHGWARLKHKSRLRNPRSKGKGCLQCKTRSSGNAEITTASSSLVPLFRMSLLCRVVLWQRGHNRYLRDSVGSYARALTQKSHWSLTARMPRYQQWRLKLKHDLHP
jgi:hypothetical protein